MCRYYSSMLQGFKQFILKGNVVDLAVAVVIGSAIGNLVTSLVKGIIFPLIGSFGGWPDFSTLTFTFNNSKFLIGDFLNALMSFLIIAAVIYFFIAVPINKLAEIAKVTKPAPADKTCSECLSLIPSKARRCKFCTAIQKKK
jgi:large conductance mechanosensitive channel